VTYDAFGNIVANSEMHPENGDRYKYAGYQLEATTGLYFVQARWYDPSTGRWTSEDPIGLGGGDGNFNRYVGNGPTNGTDPTGLAWIRHVENQVGTVGLFYVKNRVRRFLGSSDGVGVRIGILDPMSDLVWRQGYYVEYTKIEQLVHSIGTPDTFEGWNAWFKSNAINAPIGPLTAGSIGTYWGQSYKEAFRDVTKLTKAMLVNAAEEAAGTWSPVAKAKLVRDVIDRFNRGDQIGAWDLIQVAKLRSKSRSSLAPRTKKTEQPSRSRAFLCEADPARRVLGPARVSHKDMIAAMRRVMEADGVEIKVRPGTMAYSPCPVPGKRAGQFIIDPEASYAAWLHEYRHYLDDKSTKWNGVLALMDKNTRWAWEVRAYAEEMKYMRRLGHRDVIEDLMRARTREWRRIYMPHLER
jgi:RHS repeat-associated protein